MGQTIWDVLASYEGCWVAVDKKGVVVARSGSLEETTRLVGADVHRVTFLYAAGPSEEPAESSRS
jgi:hypothetical protein